MAAAAGEEELLMVVSRADAYREYLRQKAEWEKTPEGKAAMRADAKRAHEWFRDWSEVKDMFKPKEQP